MKTKHTKVVNIKKFIKRVRVVLLIFCSLTKLNALDEQAKVVISDAHGIIDTASFQLSKTIPEDESGIVLLDETVERLKIAKNNSIARFEKETGRKYNPDDADGLNPWRESTQIYIDTFKKVKGTSVELLALYWIFQSNIFSNKQTYPAILQAWQKYSDHWEVILLYGDELLMSESMRKGMAEKSSDKRSILLWVISERRKVLTKMTTINTENWKNSKTLTWWFNQKYLKYVDRPGAPTKPEDLLPSHAWAANSLIWSQIELLDEKLCTGSEAKDVIREIRACAESSLQTESNSRYEKEIRKALSERLPEVEKELAAHPELWPVSLPKWDGRPSWEIKLKNE